MIFFILCVFIETNKETYLSSVLDCDKTQQAFQNRKKCRKHEPQTKLEIF